MYLRTGYRLAGLRYRLLKSQYSGKVLPWMACGTVIGAQWSADLHCAGGFGSGSRGGVELRGPLPGITRETLLKSERSSTFHCRVSPGLDIGMSSCE